MTKLAELYDKALATFFEANGYIRLAVGFYARSDDTIVWHAILIVFTSIGDVLSTQPSLGIFCPVASRIVDEGLMRKAENVPASKLGEPFIIRPLYECVRTFNKEDRMPFSYDIETVYQVENAAKLIFEDFSKVANKFFGRISSMQSLQDYIVAHPSGTAASINVMALTYLLNEKCTFEEIDKLSQIRPSPMTKRFALYLKSKMNVQI